MTWCRCASSTLRTPRSEPSSETRCFDAKMGLVDLSAWQPARFHLSWQASLGSPSLHAWPQTSCPIPLRGPCVWMQA